VRSARKAHGKCEGREEDDKEEEKEKRERRKRRTQKKRKRERESARGPRRRWLRKKVVSPKKAGAM